MSAEQSGMSAKHGGSIDRRRVLKLGAAAGGVAWAAPSLTSVAVAQSPGTPEPTPTGPRVVGAGTGRSGGVTFELAIDATGGVTPVGTVSYSNPSASFTGTVSCVVVSGNEGTVSGNINPGAVGVGGDSFFRAAVRDGTPDMVRVATSAAPFPCVGETTFPGEIISGDFVVSS